MVVSRPAALRIEVVAVFVAARVKEAVSRGTRSVPARPLRWVRRIPSPNQPITALLCVLGTIAGVGLRSLVAQAPDTAWVEVTGPGVGRPPLRPAVVRRIDPEGIGEGVGKIVLLVATPGGGVALLDGQPAGPPLIVLDAEGKVVRRLGRYGEGPGEFSRSATVAVDRTGGVHVADAMLRRLTRWSGDGRLIDSRAFAAIGIAERAGAVRLSRPGCLALGERVYPDDAGSGTLWLVAPHRYQLVCGSDLSVSLPLSERRIPPATPRTPYGRESFRVPLSDGRIATVSSDVLGFSWWSTTGTVRGVRRSITAPAVLDAERREWTAVQQYVEANFPPIFRPPRRPLPDHKQVVTGAVADPTGLLWLARSTSGIVGAPRTEVSVPKGPAAPLLRYRDQVLYSVFTNKGEYLADVVFPDGIEHLVFAGSTVWGITHDESGWETLVKFEVPLPGR